MIEEQRIVSERGLLAMAKNASLNKAGVAKEDEFYTQLNDIENEMRHYREHFRGKTVFCNCDDPYESNFFKYFAMNFNFLGLKKLIATCYIGSPIADTQLSLFDDDPPEDKTTRSPHKIEILEVDDYNGDGAVDLADVEYLLRNKKNALTRLDGDGDFRSVECVELLKEADIVVTNPPFSLFREYVAQLMDYHKKFIIVGSKNALTYKDIFKYVKDNRIWLGIGFQNGNAFFKIPSQNIHDFADGVYDEKTGLVKFRNVGWYTNIDHKKRHESIFLFRNYTPQNYFYYDNYDIINVDKLDEIPGDWKGVMGVPITFLDRYNPDQFEILGIANSARWIGHECYTIINGKKIYNRILIKAIGVNE